MPSVELTDEEYSHELDITRRGLLVSLNAHWGPYTIYQIKHYAPNIIDSLTDIALEQLIREGKVKREGDMIWLDR